MYVFIVYNLVDCCGSFEHLNVDKNRIGSVLLFMPKYCYVFSKKLTMH